MVKAFIFILISTLVGIMFYFFSPQATLSMDEDERFWFWILLGLIGGAGIFTCEVFLTFFKLKWNDLTKAFLQSICGTVAVLTPLYQMYSVDEIPPFTTTVLFIWIVMILILAGTFILSQKVLKTRPNAIAISEPDETPAKIPAKILNRLPVHLQSSDLYALSSEDHYVRVHTSKGDDIILMRLSDAILDTGDVEGLQVHRSWWVAKTAISHIKSTGRNGEITLKNDGKVPVSRNGLKTVRDIGWL